MCAQQIVVAVGIEARQLGNGVDNVVNATLERVKILRLNGEGTKIYCSFTEMKRKIWAEYFISNAFTNRNYGSLKETPLICKALEQSSQ